MKPIDKVSDTINSIISIMENTMLPEFLETQINYKYMKNQCANTSFELCITIMPESKEIEEETLWLVKCSDKEPVTIETLKKLQLESSYLTTSRKKITVINSMNNFSREAIDYAIMRKIGLARISDCGAVSKPDDYNSVVHRTSPIELINVLCKGFGDVRKPFYGFTTTGKIDHLGSLEGYIRSELLST